MATANTALCGALRVNTFTVARPAAAHSTTQGVGSRMSPIMTGISSQVVALRLERTRT